MSDITHDEQAATLHRQNQIRSELLLRALHRHHSEITIVDEPPEPPAPPTIIMQEPSPEFKELWFHLEKDPEPATPPKVSDVQRVVCRYFGITSVELTSRRRFDKIVKPRQIAMYLSSKLTRRSLPEIGRRFTGMDHTTVLHAVRRIESLCLTDWKIAHDVAHLEARFNS